MRILRLLCLVFIFATTAVLDSAYALITVYTDETSFMAALAGSATTDFSDLIPGYVTSPKSLDYDPYDFTVSVFDQNWNPTPGNTLYARDINGSMTLGAISSYDYIEFTFQSGNVNAFGGYIFGVDYMSDLDPGATITISINDNGDFIDDFVYPLSNPTGTTFIGFITDQPNFTWIDLDSSFAAYSTFDNITVGSTVPEPTSGTLIGAGLFFCALARRKRLR